MSRNPQSLVSLALLTLLMAGCGAPGPAAPSLSKLSGTAITANAIPVASAFKTFTVKVREILPEDRVGLPHQNFIVLASDGQIWEVNNDTKYGSLVPNLTVGESLVIKGTVYKNTDRQGNYKQGIHWTHKANVANDAGWIKTPDGKVYQ